MTCHTRFARAIRALCAQLVCADVCALVHYLTRPCVPAHLSKSLICPPVSNCFTKPGLCQLTVNLALPGSGYIDRLVEEGHEARQRIMHSVC